LEEVKKRRKDEEAKKKEKERIAKEARE